MVGKFVKPLGKDKKIDSNRLKHDAVIGLLRRQSFFALNVKAIFE